MFDDCYPPDYDDDELNAYRLKGLTDPNVSDEDDDGTMPQNALQLHDAVVGHKIVEAGWQQGQYGDEGLQLVLDNGQKVMVLNTSDCCAYTTLGRFLFQPEKVDHVITGVRLEAQYQRWFIFADAGDVLELEVGWSAGNPFYYGYGFEIKVEG